MKKTWIVLKTEFINAVTRRSFLLTLILVPLIPAIILGVLSLIGSSTPQEGIANLFQPAQGSQLSEGYVDQAHIITDLPEWIEDERLVPFPSEQSAQAAITSGEISGFYLIPSDYIVEGSIVYVREDFNPMSAMDTTWIIDSVLRYNLLDRDQDKLDLFQNPVQVKLTNLSPTDEDDRDQNSLYAFYLPYGVSMLFYALILTSSSMLLNNISKEKENRTLEILLSSIKPRQLLAGKILGLGLVGLLQMVFWMGSALLLLRAGGTMLNIPPSLQLSPQILYWGIAFFILGYLIYATLMAGVGALVSNLKEASQATFLIILPILIPLLMIGVIIQEPHAILPVILSLIPFTAPNTMMTRMAASTVPLWQLLLSLSLMLGTVFFLIRAVANMFRAQVLLTGKKFTIITYLRVLLGKDIETLPSAEE